MTNHETAEQIIARVGWMVMAVFPDAEGPGFAYTIGLSAKGLPELIAFSMPPATAHVLLNVVAQQMVDGPMPPLNTRLTEFADGAHLQLIEAQRELALPFMVQAEHRYPHYRALQLVWTDAALRFPWESGYDPKFIGLQPVLRARLH